LLVAGWLESERETEARRSGGTLVCWGMGRRGREVEVYIETTAAEVGEREREA
jgi:hypothetical protein